MAEHRRKSADHLPTLTEVVVIEPVLAAVAPRAAPGPLAAGLNTVTAASELSAEVLFDLEQRIDSQFEARLREALAPALARAAEGLIREVRAELSEALERMVRDAVTRALERHTDL